MSLFTMDGISAGWFTESNEVCPGANLSLQIENILHQEQSPYQKIMLLQTKNHGKALILDGIIQCTEYDEFSYQEMIAFLPLCSHPNPKKVLIVGGGDGGVAREVCKHASVEQVIQVEIDERVLELSKKYLPSMAVGLEHPKVQVVVGDGFSFMKTHEHEFDVIITDSSDPIGPAIPLFQKEYFELMRSALKSGGIVCSQAGTVWANSQNVVDIYNVCKETFPVSAYAYTSVPTYPTGQIGFVLGSLSKETHFKEPFRVSNENEMNLRYYSDKMHKTAFLLPKFVEELLYGNTK